MRFEAERIFQNSLCHAELQPQSAIPNIFCLILREAVGRGTHAKCKSVKRGSDEDVGGRLSYLLAPDCFGCTARTARTSGRGIQPVG